MSDGQFGGAASKKPIRIFSLQHRFWLARMVDRFWLARTLPRLRDVHPHCGRQSHRIHGDRADRHGTQHGDAGKIPPACSSLRENNAQTAVMKTYMIGVYKLLTSRWRRNRPGLIQHTDSTRAVSGYKTRELRRWVGSPAGSRRDQQQEEASTAGSVWCVRYGDRCVAGEGGRRLANRDVLYNGVDECLSRIHDDDELSMSYVVFGSQGKPRMENSRRNGIFSTNVINAHPNGINISSK